MRKVGRGRRQRGCGGGEGDFVPIGDQVIGIHRSQAAGHIVADGGVVIGGRTGADLSFRYCDRIAIGIRDVDGDGVRCGDAIGGFVGEVARYGVGANRHIVEGCGKLRRQRIEHKVRLALATVFLID